MSIPTSGNDGGLNAPWFLPTRGAGASPARGGAGMALPRLTLAHGGPAARPPVATRRFDETTADDRPATRTAAQS